MNPIRAGEATTPESSQHTSAFDRIVAHRQREQAESEYDPQRAPDGWLCTLTIDERQRCNAECAAHSATGRRASDKGLIPLSLADYLKLLDASGRLIRDDKTASIPAKLAPILEAAGIQRDVWPDGVTKYHDWFGPIVGLTKKLAESAVASCLGIASGRFSGLTSRFAALAT